MKVIFKGKGEGKTTDCVAMANKSGAYLVVRNRDTASALATLGDFRHAASTLSTLREAGNDQT